LSLTLPFTCNHTKTISVSEQFPQLFAGGGLAVLRGFAWLINPLGHLEVLTEIAPVLVRNRFRSPVTALIGGTGVITDAVQTDPKIVPALEALFTAARLSRQFPFTSTMMAMTSHLLILSGSNRQGNGGVRLAIDSSCQKAPLSIIRMRNTVNADHSSI
jgi:hypothetical protein